MNYYFRITKTSNECEFRRGRIINLSRYSGETYYFYDEDGRMCQGTVEALKNLIINAGGDCEVYSSDATKTTFLKCRAAAGDKFEVGKYYRIDVDKYNADDENPFRYCIEGVEVLNSEMTDVCEYSNSPTQLFANIVSSLAGHYRFITVSHSSYLNEALPKLESEFQVKKYEKYTPTEEELETIKAEMKTLLTTYDHPWTDHGIDAIIDEWVFQKGELISAFMSHPNYNGNFQLVFSNETYVDTIDKRAGSRFVEWVCGNFNTESLLVPMVVLGKTRKEWKRLQDYLNATMPLVVPILSGDKLELINYDLFEKRRREIEHIAFVINMFQSEYTEESVKNRDNFFNLMDVIREYKVDRVNEEFADYVNRRLPEVRAREGQKTTKVVGKIMKHYSIHLQDGFAKAYALYCDAINVIRTTRHTVLSLHPIDFLTQSFGNSWSSCHTIDKYNKRNKPGDNYHGQYCSGTVSYMLDSTSFVLYTVSADYTGKTFYEQDKISRCMFHIGNDKIVQGRCYPQAEDGNNDLYTQLRNLVQKVVAEMWEIPNMWKIQRSDFEDYINAYGTNYRDFFHYSGCNISKFKYSESHVMDRSITIGHDPICTVCGEEHEVEGHLHCCDRAYTCPECGAIVHNNDNYVTINGQRYHSDCVFYCAYHDRYEPESERYGYVERYGNICREAYEVGEFMHCEQCGSVYDLDDMQNVLDMDGNYRTICPECLDRNYTYVASEDEYYDNRLVAECEHCYGAYLDEHLTEVNGEYVCPGCLERVRAEQTEANEVA